MKNFIFATITMFAVPSYADIVSQDANGQISVQTAKLANLCVDSGATACGTIKAGIGSSNRVGINNTSPTTALDVGGTVTATGMSVSTITTTLQEQILRDGVSASAAGGPPDTNLLMLGNSNFFQQAWIQSTNNLGASGYTATGDLGSHTTWFGTFGINNSRAQTNPLQNMYLLWPSSAVFASSSDGPLIIAADTNGSLNSGTTSYLQFMVGLSSPPNTGSMYISSMSVVIRDTVTVQGNAFSVSGATFSVIAGKVGVGTSTPRAGLDVSVTGSTIAAVFTPMLSSFTVVNATGSYTNTTLNACIAQSTASLTLPSGGSGTISVSYVGSSSSTVSGSTVTVGILVDGAYATIAGVAETSSKGIVSFGQGTSLAQGGQDMNISFGPIPITGLSAASHSVCLTIKSTSGQVTLDSVNNISLFSVYYLP